MKKLILAFALVGAGFAQSFPSALYTAPIAADNVATTLSSAMAIGDTAAVVTSSTGFVANMLAYICDGTQTGTAGKCTGTFEVMKVTNVAGSILTVTRAQSGTSAVAHAKGKAISNSIISAYVNGPANEVQAIEAALGANLSNVNTAYPAAKYDFAPQTPDGSLSAGTQTITLTPCPLGVSGSNTGQYLYVQTTGTPEAVPITASGGAGTCAGDGVASGTVKVTVANSHANGYTIRSATAGIQEAINAAPSGSLIWLAGQMNTYATVTTGKTIRVSGGSGGVAGSGIGAQIIPQFTGDVFHTSSCNLCTFDHFGVYYATAQASGSVFNLEGWQPRVFYVQMQNPYNCIYETDSGQGDYAHNVCTVFQNVGVRIHSSTNDATGPKIIDSVFDNSLSPVPLGNGIGVLHDNTGAIVITGNHFNALKGTAAQNSGTGLSSQIVFSNNVCDGPAVGCLYLDPAGAYINVTVTGNTIRNWQNRSTFFGIFIGSNITIASVTGNNITCLDSANPASTTLYGIVVNGADATVTGNTIRNCNKPLSIAGTNVTVSPQGSVGNTTAGLFSGTGLTMQKPYPMTYAFMNATSGIANGSEVFCSDCNPTCTAGASTGRTCFRENAAWTH